MPVKQNESELIASITKALLNDSFVAKLGKALTPCFETLLVTMTEKITALETKVSSLEMENKKLKRDFEVKTDDLEQHGRLNSLRFFNMPQLKPNETCDELICKTVKKHLHVDITPNDIDVSHPLSPPKNGKNNVIVKFVSRTVRNNIFSKKKLFSTRKPGLTPNPDKISMAEDLTKPRQRIIKRLNELFKERRINASWTKNGQIFCKIKEDDPRPIKINYAVTQEEIDKEIFG